MKILDYSADNFKSLDDFAADYIDFLSACKTERECIAYASDLSFTNHFDNLSILTRKNTRILPGHKVFLDFMGKCGVFFILGSRPISEGLKILGAHIDTCRLDLKQNPLYESDGLALLDTHYYGGIKKYQWVTIPLELRGVVCLKSGETVKISVDDPVFCVTDLLIHLAQDQLKKDAAKVITGENLDVLCGNFPLKGSEKNPVKANVLKILKDNYGFSESDFISAELSFVPYGRAKFLGFDKSMILGYGQDDRACAFASLRAFIDSQPTEKTLALILVDKEEIGSFGATGMRSNFFINALAELINLTGENYSDLTLRRALQNSFMLSSDVSSAFDPLYKDAFDKNNVAYLSRGMVFNKFTGSRGKSGSNDANPEFIARLRNCLDSQNVSYQFSELGKVDLGGGGTIAHMTAAYSMNVIDAGVPVLSMHAPFEVTSKFDIFESYKGYRAFLSAF